MISDAVLCSLTCALSSQNWEYWFYGLGRVSIVLFGTGAFGALTSCCCIAALIFLTVGQGRHVCPKRAEWKCATFIVKEARRR
jgi:hypothetical protein